MSSLTLTRLSSSLTFAVASLLACGEAVTTQNDSAVNVTVGDPPIQNCNGDAPDGFCNIKGGNPETCSCFDCVEDPICLNLCTDDGDCSAKELEGGCACADCAQECMTTSSSEAGPGPGPGGGGAAAGGGGAAAGGAAAGGAAAGGAAAGGAAAGGAAAGGAAAGGAGGTAGAGGV